MDLSKYIEHTNLKQDARKEDIKKLAKEAISNNFFGICVNPNYVKYAKDLLKNSKVKLVSVVNFPLGTNKIETTIEQIKSAIQDGADEIDDVICVSDVKNSDWEKIEKEISLIKKACGGHNLKVILETDLLSEDEIKAASIICAKAGADFVKTSTGFVKNGVGARVEDVKIMYNAVKDYDVQVKASGGIKTREDAINLINAGASRLGTSSGMEIIKNEGK